MTFDQLAPVGTGLRAGIIIVSGIICLWVANMLLDLVVPKLARMLTNMSDQTESADRLWQLRRLETFLGIGAAMVRAVGVCIVFYLAWRLITPSTAPIALIGASAFLAIVAGSTVGPLLRDITFGSMMIAERWYNVGDHIIVEPFLNVSGVVERLTPRSTKLRSLTGEAIWMHNQHIQAARVTSRGVRTMAVEVFVNDLEAGKEVIERAIQTLPTGPTMIARQVEITETEQLASNLWRITAVGQAIPGREWLIEDFAMKAILKVDGERAERTIVHGPIARYADDTAERRFKRAVRARV